MLVKCPDCGTLVSDKATKCPKCGKELLQEKTAPVEFDGIVKILRKLVEILSRFPDEMDAQVAVYPDNFTTDPLIEVLTMRETEYIRNATSGVDLDKELWFNYINTGNKSGAIRIYKERTNSDLESSKDYVDSLERRMKEKSTSMENSQGSVRFLVLINVEDLRKMNLVAGFEALDYYEEFISKDDPDYTSKWVNVNDAKVAARIVYDLFVGVFRKNLDSARFVITDGGDERTDYAKYNSAGEFLEGKGYGQGEFAYYKSPDREPEIQQFAGADVQQEESRGSSKLIWRLVIGGLVGGLVAFLSYL